MIEKYKRRLIFITMGVIMSVLSLILFGVNLANAIKLDQTSDIIINILLDNNGKFPTMGEQGIVIGQSEEGDIILNPEVPHSSRYFTIETNVEGEIISVNCERVVSVNEEQAKLLFLDVKDGKSKGFAGNYRYGKKTSSNGEFYVFLDRATEIENVNVFLFFSVMFLIVGTLLMALIIVILTEFALKPVEESYVRQKQFITDAGHELKTPLAVISANTEILEMEYGESEYLQEIKTQIEKLNELTKNLVLLSKMDEGPATQNFIKFNLTACVEECYKNVNTLAKSYDRKIALKLISDYQYLGSEENIRRMITLLLENAIKYSKSKHITLRMKEEGKNIVISTVNKSEFEKGNYNQLFERFYRPDKSRNKETGGSGIGLSVVQSIAEIHNGSASANCDLNGYLTIKVALHNADN